MGIICLIILCQPNSDLSLIQYCKVFFLASVEKISNIHVSCLLVIHLHGRQESMILNPAPSLAQQCANSMCNFWLVVIYYAAIPKTLNMVSHLSFTFRAKCGFSKIYVVFMVSVQLVQNLELNIFCSVAHWDFFSESIPCPIYLISLQSERLWPQKNSPFTHSTNDV